MLKLVWYLTISFSSLVACYGAKVASDAYRVTGLDKFGAEGKCRTVVSNLCHFSIQQMKCILAIWPWILKTLIVREVSSFGWQSSEIKSMAQLHRS